MAIRVAINGFGRIGRAVLRANYEVARSERKLDIVAINDLGDAQTNAYLTEFDSTHGRFKKNISFTDNSLVIDGDEISMFASRNPE